jgi:hypothetical protein
MIKNVTYRDKSYKIQYDYQQYRSINTPRKHELFLLNSKDEKIYSLKWNDTYKQRENIIGKIRELINKYLENNYSYDDSMYLNEFDKWNGQLDNWDE